MTEEAKLVFVNAIHYISQFKGQRAFVKKRAMITRDAVDDMLYGISDEGFANWQVMIAEMQKEDEKRKEELRQRQKDGETLSDFEKGMLSSPPFPGYERKEMLRPVPERVQKEFGTDWERYIAYYTENRPYIYLPTSEGQPVWEFEIDEDAKQLGIANHDIRLLDRCVELLESQQDEALANRLLARYTNQSFETVLEWKQWLDASREYLFFSDTGGYKFLIDINLAGESTADKTTQIKVMSKEDFQSRVNELQVQDPEHGRPVKFSCLLVPVQTEAGERLRVTVKVRILEGWHIYASVPPGQPYTTTKLETVTRGLAESGDWEKTSPQRYPHDPNLFVWQDECVFTKDFQRLDEGGEQPQVQLTISYQVCDVNSCLRPTQETFELGLE